MLSDVAHAVASKLKSALFSQISAARRALSKSSHYTGGYFSAISSREASSLFINRICGKICFTLYFV